MLSRLLDPKTYHFEKARRALENGDLDGAKTRLDRFARTGQRPWQSQSAFHRYDEPAKQLAQKMGQVVDHIVKADEKAAHTAVAATSAEKSFRRLSGSRVDSPYRRLSTSSITDAASAKPAAPKPTTRGRQTLPSPIAFPDAHRLASQPPAAEA